jgi:glutamyl-tRNA reductase
MSLTVVGVSHRTAPVEVRERIAYRGVQCADAAARVSLGAASEGIVLSTCNRTEFYLARDGGPGFSSASRELSDRLGMDAAPHLYVKRDRDTVAHIFAVASGLDSMVFGESQIQGQVREALEHCSGIAGPVLNKLFRAAGGCASRVRTETKVARGAGSVSSAAVQLAKKIFGSLRGRRAMVLGAGKVAEISLECLVAEGVRVAIVANRTFSRAEELAFRHNAQALHYDQCWTALHAMDLVICSTAAPGYVVHRNQVESALRRRGGHPLCILDIALPRDVAPDVGLLDNVFLYDLDDLHAAAKAAIDQRREDLPAAEAIIAAETEHYWQWLVEFELGKAQAALLRRMESLLSSRGNSPASLWTAETPSRLGSLSDHVDKTISPPS